LAIEVFYYYQFSHLKNCSYKIYFSPRTTKIDPYHPSAKIDPHLAPEKLHPKGQDRHQSPLSNLLFTHTVLLANVFVYFYFFHFFPASSLYVMHKKKS